MSPESVVLFRSAGSVIIALLFVVSFWIVVVPMFEGDKKKKRMEAVATARENMRKSRLDNLQAEARLRSDGKGVAKNLVDRFSLEKLLEASDLKDKMAQAGLRGQKPVYIFYMSRLVLPIALGRQLWFKLSDMVRLWGIHCGQWQMRIGNCVLCRLKKRRQRFLRN